MNDLSGPIGPLLETDILRSFVAIAETGSFTRAGRLVGRTPSAISMQIKKLEETLGRPVFSRDGRQVSLTDDGEALLSYARRMLMLNQEALARFRAPAVESVVAIGAPDDFGTRFLPNILSRFALTHPGVQVEVRLDESVNMRRQITDGALDLAIVSGVSEDRPTGEIVYTEPMVWAGIKSGCAWCRDPLPLALASPDCAWRRSALAALDKAGRDYRIAYTSPHCAGQMAAILADLAVAPWPPSLIDPPLADIGDIGGLPELGSYHLALLRKSGSGEVVEALATHVAESFRDERQSAGLRLAG